MTNTKINFGWQSWSYCNNYSPWLPRRYFSPFGGEDTLSVIKRKSFKPPISGWCSWHWFGLNISEKVILNQAKFIAQNRSRFPLDYILIDAGWCKIGDWLEPNKEKFPQGMKTLASSIRSMGLKPGIWIAPFFAEYTSNIFRNHPEWLVRDNRGRVIEGTKVGYLDSFSPLGEEY